MPGFARGWPWRPSEWPRSASFRQRASSGRGSWSGVSLILAGVLTAGSARWRWQSIDRAMRAERRIPQPILGYVVAAIVVLDGLATIVLLLRADAG